MVDISPAKDGGILKEIIKDGIGEETPVPGSNVVVHYTGTLLNGSKFDSSKDRNKPFTFSLGEGSVIKAWDIGVATMRKGEIAMLTCAPEYAYGQNGCPPKIPPNSTLKFEIEVISWIGEDLSPNKDKSIVKFIIVPGEGSIKPGDCSLVDVHLIGKYNDHVFEDRDVQFSLEEGEDCGVIEGIEIALKSFKKGEKSNLKINSNYAFKKEGKPEFNIPPNADVEYIVELKSFEKGMEDWLFKPPQRVEQARLCKEKGTNYFKANKYNLAIKMYKKIISYVSYEYDYEGEVRTERNSLLLSAHLNLALCYLKTDECANAKESCNSALEKDPRNVKALFRRGQAHIALAATELAIKDFKAVLEIEPTNTAALKQVVICNELIKKQLEKEKKLYANMFDKFAKEDKQKEEEERRKLPDVMRGALGEWGQEERPGGRDATAFEKENPNILMLNANGTGEFQHM